MEITYAKVDMTYSPGIVVNIQVLDPSVDAMDPAFTWVDLTNVSPQPLIGWAYDGTNFIGVISSPYLGDIPDGVPVGTATTFTTFNMSAASGSFPVSISGRILTIGCMYYDYIWCRYALYMLLTQGVSSVGILSAIGGGAICHNASTPFNIVAADVTLVYNALCSLSNYGTSLPLIVTPPPLTTLQILEIKAQDYISFGTDLYAQISAQVWAANTLAISQGTTMTSAQLLQLLSTSTSLQQTLESGSLNTALYVISQLVVAFPQYATIGANATASINAYLTSP